MNDRVQVEELGESGFHLVRGVAQFMGYVPAPVFGQFLERSAVRRRWLQVQGLPVERVIISKIETSYREVTDVKAEAIAMILGVSVGWPFGEDNKTDNLR